MKKYELIKKIFQENNKNNYKYITIFTKGFMATGEFQNSSSVKEVITLLYAKVYFYLPNCESETTEKYIEVKWLNVFAKDIVAFSFVE